MDVKYCNHTQQLFSYKCAYCSLAESTLEIIFLQKPPQLILRCIKQYIYRKKNYNEFERSPLCRHKNCRKTKLRAKSITTPELWLTEKVLLKINFPGHLWSTIVEDTIRHETKCDYWETNYNTFFEQVIKNDSFVGFLKCKKAFPASLFK